MPVNVDEERRANVLRKKLVAVGDGFCGKTCLLLVFSQDNFPEDVETTVFDTYVADIEVKGKLVELALWDTAGQEDYDRLRRISYPDADVVLICYSVNSHETLDNAEKKWAPEVRYYCPGIPYVLVATKTDLRNNPDITAALEAKNEKMVSPEEGIEVAKRMGACAYMESSAITRDGIKEVFEVAALATLKKKKWRHKKLKDAPDSNQMSLCSIL